MKKLEYIYIYIYGNLVTPELYNNMNLNEANVELIRSFIENKIVTSNTEQLVNDGR